jgi:UDP-N-acetylglucosamine--N-acetylmuramyl-(pentapeptide) pyrophosphoryl-undecaprenol N-acetylglucosamine transferase
LKRIVLTGGGTAGHVTPNLALIPSLLKEGWDVHYVGTADGIERRLIESLPGVSYHIVSTGKLRRYFDLKNLTDPLKVVAGAGQSLMLLRKLRPNLVFAKGGFVSVPVVYGAAMLRIPVLLHESDMTPGLANKLAMPFAKKLLCTFPEAAKLAGAKGLYAGTPLRPELFSGSREKGLKMFGFRDDRPVLMVVGGSSGAQSINRALRQALPALTSGFQVLHLCGAGNLEGNPRGNPGLLPAGIPERGNAPRLRAADL